MAKEGFQRAKEIKSTMATPSLISEASDLIYKSPDGRVWIGIQALSKDEDLRVGFTYSDSSAKQSFFSLAVSMILGLFSCFLSILLIGHGELPLATTIPIEIRVLVPTLIFFLVFIGGLILLFGKPQMTWRKRVKAILVKTAELMGSKQITPFKRTAVKLETKRPSRLYRAFTIVVIVFFVIVFVLFILSIL